MCCLPPLQKGHHALRIGPVVLVKTGSGRDANPLSVDPSRARPWPDVVPSTGTAAVRDWSDGVTTGRCSATTHHGGCGRPWNVTDGSLKAADM
jgi:hypothetical protein